MVSYINRGPLVQKGSKWEKHVKVTFDDFLKTLVEAWRVGLPYALLVEELSEHDTDIISTWTNLWWVNMGIGTFDEGFSSKSEFEVDWEEGGDESDSDDKDGYGIMQVNGFPFILGSPRVRIQLIIVFLCYFF